MMLGWPRGSSFSRREKMTWYPRICPCCLPCMGGFQVTRMAVEFTAVTSSFLGGAPGTEGGEGEGRQGGRGSERGRDGGGRGGGWIEVNIVQTEREGTI